MTHRPDLSEIPAQSQDWPGTRCRKFGHGTPLGRAGHPIEVAAAYVFLASDEASYVSGTVVGVTGGKPVF